MESLPEELLARVLATLLLDEGLDVDGGAPAPPAKRSPVLEALGLPLHTHLGRLRERVAGAHALSRVCARWRRCVRGGRLAGAHPR